MPAEEGGFDSCLGCLSSPALAELDAELASLTLLGGAERTAVLTGVATSVTDALRRKTSRLLLVELNLAAQDGTLAARTAEARWAEFVERASAPRFWRELGVHYPTVLRRLDTVVSNRCAAGAEFARRFAVDRHALGELGAVSDEPLTALDFGQGDTHRGGRSVALLSFGERRVVYKPRSLAVDAALSSFLEAIYGRTGTSGSPQLDARVRVPRVLMRDRYGWSEFVAHSYCGSPAELRDYYTGIGHWLALARLFGTTDLHAENLIATAAGPVVVDCETLFTPWVRLASAGMGEATDRALEQIYSTVLLSGLLPGRGSELGWRGVDISAAGALPAQQPEVPMLGILDAGTDRARAALRPVPLAPAANLPTPDPVLEKYWPDVLTGFDALTGRLTALDRTGALEAALAGFAGAEIRGLLRATESYAELARMLWHPVSLHDEPAAVARASELLTSQARARPSAPSDPAVVAAEVRDLRNGDIPYFATSTGDGQLTGPGNTRWGEPHELIGAALASWRSADLDTERELIRTSLVSAYADEGRRPGAERLSVPRGTADDLAGRCGRLAASVAATLVRAAVRGSDGTATWIAPVLNPTGWSVQPLSLDCYSGAAGVALLLAGYQRAVAAGRVPPVEGLDELLAGTVQTMRTGLDRTLEIRSSSRFRGRPKSPGLYVGLGSQIWGWLWLDRLGVPDLDGPGRAVTLAELLPQSIAASEDCDLLLGRAGAIPALLMLAEHTGEDRWLTRAAELGQELLDRAVRVGNTAYWPSARAPHGLGGFAHGGTGIGWSLARLSLATGDAAFADTAHAAFAFEERLYEPSAGDWRDLRQLPETAPAWCHGAVGIGLAAADLLRLGFGDPQRQAEVIRRAAAACWARGMDFNHSICHGDLGGWELLDAAVDLGLAPAGVDGAELAAHILGSIEQNGPVGGVARQAFSPGLLPGLSGVAYQLLRMLPSNELGSVLVPGAAVHSPG